MVQIRQCKVNKLDISRSSGTYHHMVSLHRPSHTYVFLRSVKVDNVWISVFGYPKQQPRVKGPDNYAIVAVDLEYEINSILKLQALSQDPATEVYNYGNVPVFTSKQLLYWNKLRSEKKRKAALKEFTKYNKQY